MRVAVIADLMASPDHGASDRREAFDIPAADEKRRRRPMAVEYLQQLRRPFAGAVVKGQRNRLAATAAAVDRGREQSRGTAADGVSHCQASRANRSPKSYPMHRQNCNTPR